MTEASAAIRIENVSKSFGTVSVLSSTSLNIKGGEFFSLLGPSGCGKTTLLNIMGGMEQPDSGRILVDGQDITRLPPERRPTNMVFQSYAIFPHLSVAKNVGYGLRSRRVGRQEANRKVERMLDLMHLADMGDRDPAALSGGQRQRVALARALVLEPKVLLLDESLAALDRRLREAMQVELRQLQRRVGITFVFVTHDQDEAMAMSDRIAVMGDGGILQIATPSELYHRPASRAVAEFIGSINLIPIRAITSTGGDLQLDAGGLGSFVLRAEATPDAKEQSLLALRPEDLSVHSEPPPPGINRIAGAIEEHVFLGDRSFLRVRAHGLAEHMTVACGRDRDWSNATIGDAVWLSWNATSGRLLSSK